MVVTPTVLAIRGVKIQKKKNIPQVAKSKGSGKGKGKSNYAPKPKIPPPARKEHPAKNSIYHHCGEVDNWRRNCPAYLAELNKKKNQTSMASTSGLRGSKKIKQDALNIYVGNRMRAAVEAIGSFDLIFPNGLIILLDNCNYAPTITRGVVSLSILVDNGFIHKFTDYGISVSKDNGYALESATRILNMVPTKKVEKTPYQLWHGKVPNPGLISQEVSGENVDLEVIQDEDAQPSKNTREHHNEVEHDNFKPQSEKVPISRSARIPQAPDIWTVRSKWIIKKETDMDDNVHTFKARIVAKAYTQTYWVDHEETFSHVAKIRAIRILIAITTFYDYKIWLQVKDNKIDLLVQQYEQFTILDEKSIDSGFGIFNTIIISLKALDEGFFSKNYVRKFLRALHPKWRANVTAIEESKDLSSLALDELIGNLKVHDLVMEKDSKFYKGKKKRVKSITLKAKKESSDD
ncbi:DUF4219 domain-containing protein [Tanacetum coccineum]